jgi:hypothetical protein
MIRHRELENKPFARSKILLLKIKSGEISLGGNKDLKIYGRLDCRAGKRMKVENRVFFENETEAIDCGYRPCAVCMKKEYLIWKESLSKALSPCHFPTQHCLFTGSTPTIPTNSSDLL